MTSFHPIPAPMLVLGLILLLQGCSKRAPAQDAHGGDGTSTFHYTPPPAQPYATPPSDTVAPCLTPPPGRTPEYGTAPGVSAQHRP